MNKLEHTNKVRDDIIRNLKFLAETEQKTLFEILDELREKIYEKRPRVNYSGGFKRGV
jgi:hypothetical protein